MMNTTWQTFLDQFEPIAERADKLHKQINNRARQACKEAGLDPDLLGIHPHNAMVAYEAGKPWKGVDYQKVRLCLHLCEKSFRPHRLKEAWWSKNYPMGKL